MKRAVLLSGGIDSLALTYWHRPDIVITIDYGQAAAEGEICASRAIATTLETPHEIIRVDCSSLGSGDLLNRPAIESAPASEWWPFRNQLLATLAGMRAVALGVGELLLGSVRSDDFHRDGTEEFYNRLDSVFSFQEGEIRVCAPAIRMSSAELVRQSGVPVEVLAWAHSCHCASFACGRCRGCNKHRSVMLELGFDNY